MLLPSCMNNAYVSSYPINPHVDIVSWITVPIFTCGLGSLLYFLVTYLGFQNFEFIMHSIE